MTHAAANRDVLSMRVQVHVCNVAHDRKEFSSQCSAGRLHVGAPSSQAICMTSNTDKLPLFLSVTESPSCQ